MKIDHEQIVMLYEDPYIYDGWSVAELKDGTFVNRWASDEDPTKAMPGWGRRFDMTEKYLEGLRRPQASSDSRPTNV